MLKTCSACGSTVSRQDCHKNRYKEYVCRTCQAAGIRYTRAARLTYWLQRMPFVILWSLIGTALIALAIWAFYAAMVGFESFESVEVFRSDGNH